MAATLLTLCNSNLIHGSRKQHPWHPSLFLGVGMKILEQPCADQRNAKQLQHYQTRKLSHQFFVFATTEGSAESSKSEETIPSWARPNSDEPPPWARDEGAKEKASSQEGFAVPFYVYLLASAITAIAAIGSVFEYVNQNPVFGVLNSDSIFYAPLLGFFAFTGVPTSAFLWFKSVGAANKEAEEQDRRDGYL